MDYCSQDVLGDFAIFVALLCVESPVSAFVVVEIRMQQRRKDRIVFVPHVFPVEHQQIVVFERPPVSLVNDEPLELLGENTALNPQEARMAEFNACVMNTYVISAAMKGIKLDKVELETEGELDLRGFLGLDKSVKPG